MLKQIDFVMNGIEYIMLYDSSKLTDEQAIAECGFVGWGLGKEKDLFPYYLIIEKYKRPILQCIKEYIIFKRCRDGNTRDDN